MASAAERFRKHYLSRAYLFYIKRQPCIVPGCRATVCDAAHVVSRRAGGTWRDLFPCCHVHHMEQENGGMQTFVDKYGVDPAGRAAELVAGWVDPSPSDGDL